MCVADPFLRHPESKAVMLRHLARRRAKRRRPPLPGVPFAASKSGRYVLGLDAMTNQVVRFWRSLDKVRRWMPGS